MFGKNAEDVIVEVPLGTMIYDLSLIHIQMCIRDSQKLKIPVVLIEAQNQLGFERQDGILDLARYMDYDVCLLYTSRCV